MHRLLFLAKIPLLVAETELYFGTFSQLFVSRSFLLVLLSHLHSQFFSCPSLLTATLSQRYFAHVPPDPRGKYFLPATVQLNLLCEVIVKG